MQETLVSLVLTKNNINTQVVSMSSAPNVPSTYAPRTAQRQGATAPRAPSPAPSADTASSPSPNSREQNL